MEREGTPAACARLLLACLAIIVGSSVLAGRIQSSWGRVQVLGIRIPAHDGQWIAADLFRPRTATSEAPAPLVVIVPGFQRSKEALANVAIELSRRGIVAISIDPYAQGSSSSSLSRQAATREGYGLFAVVEYAADTPNLDYVDQARIAATGHSAGGNAALLGASHFGREAEETGRPSKLQSVFVSGYLLSFTEDVLGHVHANLGTSYARYDEGAYRNERGDADLRRAPEALRLVNTGRDGGSAPLEEVRLDHGYGDAADRTYRIVHNERVLHPFQPYDVEATAHQIAFFEHVFGLDRGIEDRLEPTDQVWYWKEALGLLAWVASMVMLVPLGRLVLEIPWFRALVHETPAALPRPRGAGRVVFWGTFALGALIACFSFIPMAELSQRLFVAASSREITWFFPQRMNNAVMLWAVLNGSLGFAVFFLTHRLWGRAHGVERAMWGAALRWGEAVRVLAYGLLMLAGYYLVLAGVYWTTHVDYRFLFMGVRPFRPAWLVVLAMYAPFLFVFFLSNSLRVNGALRLEGDPGWKSMLVAGLANSVGLFLIVAIQYATFALTGTVYWTDGWLYVNLLFAVVPMMFVLPYFHRYFFRMTGRIWAGPVVTCLVFAMILLTNTVCYLPI